MRGWVRFRPLLRLFDAKLFVEVLSVSRLSDSHNFHHLGEWLEAIKQIVDCVVAWRNDKYFGRRISLE